MILISIQFFGTVISYYQGSLERALTQLYPDIGLNFKKEG